ncbi:MAG: fructosamine kinase family protein [Pseudomonadota bacterium]|nr:MAG: fructosamine kinase family protein [Pseudomonadota bacterium]
MNWNRIAQQIAASTGEPFALERDSSAGGGCINSAHRLYGSGRSYFVKLNSDDLLDMFIAEAEGLQEMAAAHAIRVPVPVCYGTDSGQAYLVIENIEFGGRDGVAALGEQLAALHRCTKDRFGWHRNNTIGATPQINDWNDSWLEFWRAQRLGYQLELAGRRGIGSAVLRQGEQLMDAMDMLFADYQPEASLLHGDLWSGNYAISADGEPVIFDPAVYYGDREADIAMTELFGGFGRSFYATYNNAWPLDVGYKVRKHFYNLYHVLNHFNLFGGGYGSQAQGMLERILGELR